MRWRAVCLYVGTQLEGWQAQPSKRAVQDHVEKRLAEIFGREIRIHGSGRTDAGVHARGQVFHFDADWKHGAEKLERAIATGLPDSIQVRGLRRARPDFHARFGSTGKRYVYFVHRGHADPFEAPFCWSLGGRPLDVDAMRAAAKLLVGKHDFRALSAFNRVERETTVRTLRRLDVLGRGQKLRIVAEADGFLYKMVRTLVGALVGVGLGKLRPEQVAALLDGQKREHLIETAPAQGLFLWRVEYGRRSKRTAATRRDLG
jgi:tRNA pseudouridine38-40 synthase